MEAKIKRIAMFLIRPILENKYDGQFKTVNMSLGLVLNGWELCAEVSSIKRFYVSHSVLTASISTGS